MNELRRQHIVCRHSAAIRDILMLSLSLTVFSAGCGPPPMRQVTGVVTLDGQPVEHCKVGFFPDTTEFNPDRHGFGFGVSDVAGKFEIQHPQGEKGIWSGRYKVTFVLWVDSKGKVLPIDTKPSEVEGGVRNRFPQKYEEPSTTTQIAEVSGGSNHFEFNVVSD